MAEKEAADKKEAEDAAPLPEKVGAEDACGGRRRGQA